VEGAAADRAGRGTCGVDSGSAGCGSPQGDHASRSEARECPGDEARDQAAGFRTGETGAGAGSSRCDGDADADPARTDRGTLQYISPEQLQGKEPGARSDLFAFGCVLYEMLTGKRAFEGEN